MVRGRLISLLLLVSYPIPASVYAADNLAVELKSLQPSYDYSLPSDGKADGKAKSGAVSAEAAAAIPENAKQKASEPVVTATPEHGAFSQVSPTAQPAPHWLPASAATPRLLPVGWNDPPADKERPGAAASEAARQIAMAVPVDQKDKLLKQLYGWSSTIMIVFSKPVSTKTAKFGDVVEGSLVNDFTWGNRVVAQKGSVIRGHVTESTGARTLSNSTLSDDRRFRTRGCLGIQFDEIIDLDGHRWPIKAIPCRQTNTTAIDSNTARIIRVDALGRVTRSENDLAGGLKVASNTARVATFAPVPGAIVVSTIATPVAMSTVGAISPSVAYYKPVDEDVKHRRLKGAAYGFVTNLPGAFFVQSLVEKGNEIEIKEGDSLTLTAALIESGYRLPPGETLQVNGQVVKVTDGRRLYPAPAK